MKSVKETVKIRVCKGGAWERVDGALEYMPLNCVKRTLILPLLSSYSCLLEAVSERLDIDASSGFMLTYNSDNDIVEVCDDLKVNEFMEFVVKSSRIVTLCIVESSVHGTQLSTTGSNQQSNSIHATPSKMPPKRITTTTPTTPMTDAHIKALIARGVADALAKRDADRSRNGDDSHDSGGERRRRMPVARECTYSDFLMCQPLNFKENALTWWNSHVGIVGHDVAYAMPWKTLKKMMTDKYCPRGEIKNLEIKMWNLMVKGTDVLSYNQRFQNLALMCKRMFPEEFDEVEKYDGGLPDMIHGSVMTSKPKIMQDAIKFETELMDQKIRTIAERQAENKRKFDDNNNPQEAKCGKGLLCWV
ncbi:reverse transcriptase domain-containing protein [Tanacetum coccineum]